MHTPLYVEQVGQFTVYGEDSQKAAEFLDYMLEVRSDSKEAGKRVERRISDEKSAMIYRNRTKLEALHKQGIEICFERGLYSIFPHALQTFDGSKHAGYFRYEEQRRDETWKR